MYCGNPTLIRIFNLVNRAWIHLANLLPYHLSYLIIFIWVDSAHHNANSFSVLTDFLHISQALSKSTALILGLYSICSQLNMSFI